VHEWHVYIPCTRPLWF